MRGAVVGLPYPVVLAFPLLVYLVTYLRVAAGGFVLELPGLEYLVFPEYKRFALVYPVFAVFGPFVLMLGFRACISLAVVVFECGLSCGQWCVTSYLASALLDPFARCLALLALSLSRPYPACDLLSLAFFVLSRLEDLHPRTFLALLRSRPLFLLVRISPLARSSFWTPLDLLNRAVIRSWWCVPLVACNFVSFGFLLCSWSWGCNGSWC